MEDGRRFVEIIPGVKVYFDDPEEPSHQCVCGVTWLTEESLRHHVKADHRGEQLEPAFLEALKLCVCGECGDTVESAHRCRPHRSTARAERPPLPAILPLVSQVLAGTAEVAPLQPRPAAKLAAATNDVRGALRQATDPRQLQRLRDVFEDVLIEIFHEQFQGQGTDDECVEAVQLYKFSFSEWALLNRACNREWRLRDVRREAQQQWGRQRARDDEVEETHGEEDEDEEVEMDSAGDDFDLEGDDVAVVEAEDDFGEEEDEWDDWE